MNGEWKDCFSSRILNRGYEYYENGNVLDIEKTEDGYTATVEGSWEYTVTIDVDEDGDFIDADCDCPYSQDGNYCKHEAAVLYALELDGDGGLGDIPAKNNADIKPVASEEIRETSESKIREIVKKMKKEELASLVLELASSHSDIADNILHTYADKMPHSYVQKLENEIYSASSDLRNADDGGDWYSDFNEDMEDAVIKLDKILGEDLPILLDKGQFAEAFDVALYAWNNIPFSIIEERTMRRSSDIENEILSVVESAYTGSDIKQRLQMENRLSAVLETVDSYTGHYYSFVEMMLTVVEDEALAEKVIEKYGSEDDRWSVGLCILAFKTLGRENDMWNCILSHLDVETAVDAGIDEYEKQSDTKSLIEFLCKVKEANPVSSSSMINLHSAASSRLLDVFRKNNMDDDYKAELEYNILHIHQNNLDRIREYKRLADSRKWKEVYEKLKNAGTVGSDMPLLLLGEKDYEALMEWAENNAAYRPLSYERILYEYYPDRVVSLAAARAERSSAGMSNRSAYSYFAEDLAYLRVYEKGQTAAEKILEDVIKRYPRHPALKDELRSRGFIV